MVGSNATILIVTILVFASVALLSLVVSGRMQRQGRIRDRFGATALMPTALPTDERRQRRYLVDPARIGFDAAAQRRLRAELIRAGIFSPNGVPIYLTARVALLVLFPALAYLFLRYVTPDWGGGAKLAVIGLIFVVAFYLPSAWLRRRQRLLQDRYRIAFPDLVDMLVVCINAGLSLEAALARVALELGPTDAELRANLDLMAGEMRAGKSTIEALKDTAERLGLREARSLAALLAQTIELGTDIATALTVFSDEMRDRRMSRAEERAAALPPKLTLPLGVMIFPVVLMVVLTPAVLRLLDALGR